MMPVIRISTSVYQRLQQHAKAFVDTPDTVIERLLNDYETSKPSTQSSTRAKLEPTQRATEENPRAGGKPLEDGSTAVIIPEHLRDKVSDVRGALKDANPEVSITTDGKTKVKCWDDWLTGIIRALAVHEFEPDEVRLIVTVLVEGHENAAVHEGTINTQYYVGRRIKEGNPPRKGVHGGGSYCDIPAAVLKALKSALK